MRLSIFIFAGLLAAVALAAPAQALGTTFVVGTDPSVFVVGTDPSVCPNANFATIQAAVDASGPNDTIEVCPGTYTEQVRIVGHTHDGLTLVSLQPLQAVVKWPTPETFPLALVDFNTVNGVTLRGFTITGPFSSAACSADRHEGLLVENAFDERIVGNHVTLIRNTDPALYHCSEGDAVGIGRRTDPAGLFPPGSARVDGNVIDEYQKNGIQAVNPGSFVDATNNLITGSSAVQSSIVSNGVVVFRNAAAAIDGNEISNVKFAPTPFSTAIILDGAPAGSSSIKNNFIHNDDQGIEVDSESGLVISGNEVANNRSAAITLCGIAAFGCAPLTNSVVTGNFVHDNGGWGVRLGGANDNIVEGNTVTSNGSADSTNGISLVSGSSGNVIRDNHSQGNSSYDCYDDTAGSGTAGTANQWLDDLGQTENRPGLCMTS